MTDPSEMTNRYLADDQSPAGARLGRGHSWLLQVITHATASLSSDGEENRP
jgi:hypothetical protein